MKHIAGWFRRNNTIMAQAKDLGRQLQEAWDARGDIEMRLDDCHLNYYAKCADYDSVLFQLHRVARERDNERKLRLDLEEHYEELLAEVRNRLIEAEVALLDYHLDDTAADLVDIYLAELENEEE